MGIRREGRGLKRLLLLLLLLFLLSIGFGTFGFRLFLENWFELSRLLLGLRGLLLASEEPEHKLLLGGIGVHLEGLQIGHHQLHARQPCRKFGGNAVRNKAM